MKRPITLISVISILLFIAALAWFGIGIYADSKSGSERNERIFETLVFKTMNAANQDKIGTPEFSKKFIEAVGNIEDYSALKLDVNGKLIYSYPPAGFSVPSAALTNSFKKINSTRNGLVVTVSASMYAIKTNSVYHYAKLAFVLILLGTSISLILLLILSGKKEKQEAEKKSFAPKTDKKTNIKNLFKKVKKPAKEKDNFDDEFNFDYGDDSSEILDDEIFGNSNSENAEDADILTQDKKSSEENEQNDDDVFASIFDDDETLDDSNEAGDSGKSEQKNFQSSEISTDKNESDSSLPFETDISEGDYEISDEIQNDNSEKQNQENDSKNDGFSIEESDKNNDEISAEGNDKELETEKTLNDDNGKTDFSDESSSADLNFNLDSPVEPISPATGLKLQSALSEMLDEKIKKSLEEKNELTLALLKINGLDRGNTISNALVEILKKNIPDANEIYEYQTDGYAIILQNEDLTSCADIFDKIYEKLTSYLKSNNSTNEVVIGLSSVSGRTLNSKRLITEADQALNHALEDPDSPIIAFRANPEKYKEYLENNAEL